MNLLVLAGIFALAPILNFILVYEFSKKYGTLKQFQNHLSCYYLDWLFLPFNILWVFSVSILLEDFMYILLISMLGSLAIHYYWITNSIKSGQEGHLLDLGRRTFSPAGVVHALFTGFVVSLFISYLIFAFEGILSYLVGIIMILFFMGGFVSSKRIHGKVILSDALLLVLGILAILIRFFLWI